MLPGEPIAGVVGIEQAAVGEPAEHPAADLLGDGRHSVRRRQDTWRQHRSRPPLRGALAGQDMISSFLALCFIGASY